MKTLQKAAATAATFALLLPGAALAEKGGSHGPAAKGAPAAKAVPAAKAEGKAGAPGQSCKSMKVKGKKSAAQRAAYKTCVKEAVDRRKAEKDDDGEEIPPFEPTQAS